MNFDIIKNSKCHKKIFASYFFIRLKMRNIIKNITETSNEI